MTNAHRLIFESRCGRGQSLPIDILRSWEHGNEVFSFRCSVFRKRGAGAIWDGEFWMMDGKSGRKLKLERGNLKKERGGLGETEEEFHIDAILIPVGLLAADEVWKRQVWHDNPVPLPLSTRSGQPRHR